MNSPVFDYALVGGGLANGLVALQLLATRPGVRIALVERGASLGGNHTWSFHEGDVGEALGPTVARMVAARWPAHDVAFPGRERRLSTGYASMFSNDLDRVVQSALAVSSGSELLLSATASRVTAHEVELEGGRTLTARAVLDGRGPEPDPKHRGGYQKFVGLEVRLRHPSPRTLPLLMDARVPQLDGFRFVYVLPFDPHRVLLEDTYYSTSPRLDRLVVRERIASYAAEHGYEIAEVLREEVGVLPIPTHAALPPAPRGPLCVGLRGGWFHPTTGYSVPQAVRIAELVASVPPEELPAALCSFAREHGRQARFARWLNRLLFGAFAPADRFHVLERFYGLPEDTIARFYALQTTARDRSRILCGRPPRGFSVMQLFAGEMTA